MSGGSRGGYWPLALLVIQNLGVFWNHYFDGYGFPWDFNQAYFGMNSFSVRALGEGLLPQWMPYQCMGYPYALNLQSGLYYPPLWVVALLHIPYDLHAAAILQCLHVLFGAFGMFFLLRRVIDSTGFAVVGAAAFQFFGGFYSNAQHTDIIRSFALIPWLFFMLTADEISSASSKVSRILLPLFVFSLATGGYPGNLVSGCFILGLYLLLQVTDRLFRSSDRREALTAVATLALLVVLGLGLAAVHLGPSWVERGEYARSGASVHQYRSLWIEHLPLLFFSSRPLPGEPSMTSTFLTVPGLLPVFFVSWKRFKEHWIWAVILATSVLMVIGEKSFLWRALTAAAEPFRLSRFPSSDYRPLIAVALIVLAASGLKSLEAREISNTSFAVRGMLAFSAVALAGRALYGAWGARAVLLGLLIAYLALGVLYWILARSSAEPAILAACCLVVLIGLDGLRVLPDIKTWRAPAIESMYRGLGWADSAESARDSSMFDSFPPRRPAREETKNVHWYSWAGYLEGRYMLADKAPCILEDAGELIDDPVSKAFMSDRWTPLVLPKTNLGEVASLTLERRALEDALTKAKRGGPLQIRQTRYELDQISYDVSLSSESLVVENELYFPGWTAVIERPEGRTQIEALEVNGALRGWVLPPGDYELHSSFRLPHLAAYRAVSAGSLASWLAISAVGFRSRTRRLRGPRPGAREP